MFAQSPHFNQYFPIHSQKNNHLHTQKKYQQKNHLHNHSHQSSSEKSFPYAQNTEKQNKNISKKYLRPINSYNNKESHNQLNSTESIKQINFLDQFKLKIPATNQFLKQKDSLLNTYTPVQKLNKDFQKQTHNLYTSTSPKNLFSGEYFVNSINYKDHFQDKNSHKIRSKDKIIQNRSKKSPLRKIVKSQSYQMLYDPIERVFKVIKQQQKIREQQKLNQKTLKHLHFIPTFSQLNDSFLNLAKNIQEIKSQKNLKQIKSLEKQKSNHNLVLSRQYHDFAEKKQNKKQEKNRNRIKKTKSVEVMNYVVSRKNIDVKMSASKVKGYFSRKQEAQKKHEKIRDLLQVMGQKLTQEIKLRKVQSEQQISQISLSQPSKLSNSNDISNKKPQKNKLEVQPYEYSHSGSSSNYKSSEAQQSSKYGFQNQSNLSQKSVKRKRFNKTPQKFDKELPLDLKHMKMYVVDEKKRQKSPQPPQHYSQSQSFNNYENSTPSIQEYIHSKKPSVPNFSYLSSKRSAHSKTQNYQQSQSSHQDYQPVESVNTPAYRNRMQKKTQKSILNNSKNGNLKYKNNQLSVSSNNSRNQQIEIDSRVNKESSDLSNYQKGELQKDKKAYLKAPKIQSSSIIYDLSNLIDDSSNSVSSREITSKKSQKRYQIKELKNQMNQKNLKMKTTPKLSTVKDHEFSEFQMKKQSEKDLAQQINNKKRNDTSIQNSNESDLGLKSKRSIIHEESVGQESNLIPLNSSVSMKKIVSQQNASQKKEESKKVIKFLKVTNKKNELHNESIKVQDSIKQQGSQMESKSSSKSSQSKKQRQSINSERSKEIKQVKKQSKDLIKSKDLNESNKSVESNESIQGSQYSQSSQKSSEMNSSHSNSNKKSQIKSRRKNQNYSQSSQSQSSYSRTLTKSVTNNLSKASSPNNVSKSSLPNQNFKLHLHSNDSHSQSLVESSYNNNSSQTSLSKSTSNRILGHSTNNFAKKDESLMFKKKKNFAQYTLNDVARLIQEHQFRIQAYCLYVDNSKSIYEEDYQLQKIQLLSFLMLKKSVYELNRAIAALNGDGTNIFFLTDIEIENNVFEEYRQRQQIRQQRDNMLKSKKLTFQELKQTFFSLEKKYTGQKGFNLVFQKDDMSSQIVKKLSQQLNLLYQKWEQNKSNDHQLPKITKRLEKRMMEIIELIFLTSELDGQKVKGCELFSDSQSGIDFRSYYEKWFQKIIETIQYFDGWKSTNEEN